MKASSILNRPLFLGWGPPTHFPPLFESYTLLTKNLLGKDQCEQNFFQNLLTWILLSN